MAMQTSRVLRRAMRYKIHDMHSLNRQTRPPHCQSLGFSGLIGACQEFTPLT